MFSSAGRRFVVAIWLGLMLAGCSRKESAPDDAEPARIATATAELNPNPKVADFALFATNSISVGSTVIVNGGDIGVKNDSTGIFPGIHPAN